MDLAFMAIVIGFFLLSGLLVAGCRRLEERK